jgi:hypothetical protein
MNDPDSADPGAYADPGGFFSCTLPAGWGIARAGGGVTVLYLGARRGQAVTAQVAILSGRLPVEQRRLSTLDVVRANLPLIGEILAGRGIVVPQPPEPRAVTVAGTPGATAEGPAVTAAGERAHVWFGALVRDASHASVLAAVLDADRRDVLPEVEALFASMRVEVPARNLQLEQALVGRELSASIHPGDGGAIHYLYSFHPGNRVAHRSMLAMGSSGGFDAARPGTYEIFGNTLYLDVQDEGQKVGTVMVQDGQIAGIRFGDTFYR